MDVFDDMENVETTSRGNTLPLGSGKYRLSLAKFKEFESREGYPVISISWTMKELVTGDLPVTIGATYDTPLFFQRKKDVYKYAQADLKAMILAVLGCNPYKKNEVEAALPSIAEELDIPSEPSKIWKALGKLFNEEAFLFQEVYLETSVSTSNEGNQFLRYHWQPVIDNHQP